MCSLFHAFIFAQLWTVYCEQSAVATNIQSQNEFSFTAILTALEFWSRVTPSILQLMAHNKVVSPRISFSLWLKGVTYIQSSHYLFFKDLNCNIPMDGGFFCYKLDVLLA